MPTQAQLDMLNKWNALVNLGAGTTNEEGAPSGGFGWSGQATKPLLTDDPPEGTLVWISSDGVLHDLRQATGGGWLDSLLSGVGNGLWGGSDSGVAALTAIIGGMGALGSSLASGGAAGTAGAASTAEGLSAADLAATAGMGGAGEAGGLTTADLLAAAGGGTGATAGTGAGTGAADLAATGLTTGGAGEGLSIAGANGLDLSAGSLLGGSGVGTTAAEATSWLSSLGKALGLQSGTGILGSGISLGTAIAAIPTVAAAIQAATGGSGDNTVSTSTVTDTMPSYIKADAEKLWDDFIADFYGTSGGTSVQDRETQTADYKQNADTTYLTDTKTALSPYQSLLTDLQNQATAGTGYYTPVSFGFGGKKMTSFVPKTNLNTVNNIVANSKANADTGAGVAELTNALALRNLPNAAADSYSAKLQDLMKFANSGGTATTQTASTDGNSTLTDILNALSSSASIYSKLYPWQSSSTKTT